MAKPFCVSANTYSMSYGLTISVPPVGEPIDFDILKTFCLSNTEDDNKLLQHFAISARESFESLTSLTLLPRTYVMTLDSWTRNEMYTPWRSVVYPYLLPNSLGTIYLPKPPLVTVTYVKYRDLTGTLQTLNSSNYVVLTDQRPGCIKLKPSTVWPPLWIEGFPKIEITYTAGFADADHVPSRYKQAIMAQAVAWYMNRTDTTLSPGFLAMVESCRVDFAADLMDDVASTRFQ